MAITYAKFVHGSPLMVDITPAADKSAGDVQIVGTSCVIYHADVTANTLGAASEGYGVYDLPKSTAASSAIGAGQEVFWDSANNRVSTTRSVGPRLGITVAASVDADATQRVLHLPAAGGGVGPAYCTFTPAAGGANVTNISIQFKDAGGNNIAYPVDFTVSLSDAATGAGLTATTASGTVVAGASGTDLGTLTAKKALVSRSTAAGLYILQITDTAKTGFYPVVSFQGQRFFVGSQLVTANYG